MIDNEGTSKAALATSQDTRPTIGYLAPVIHDASHLQWSGMVDAAQKHNVNLLCFPGGSLHYPDGFHAQANILYDLVAAQNVDGVITWASTIGNYSTIDELAAFHKHYDPLPIVTIGKIVDDIPHLLMDSYEGMCKAIVHLIQVHGYRRLAFIRGPENHLYAQERYRAYADVLETYGIPLDPQLVSPHCHWEPHFGKEAMRLLLDERGLRPQLDFEAVVAANDHLLLGAFETLQSRGIHVPGEVAVVGFDDIMLARTSMPPFTSVVAHFYEVGGRAVEMVLAMIEGKQVPKETIVPSKLVVRQSCGCLDPAVVKAAAVTAVDRSGRTASQDEFKTILVAQRKDILDKMVQATSMPVEGQALDWAGRLLDALCSTLGGEATSAFLPTLDDILRHVRAVDGDIAAWQNVLSALRHQALLYLEGEALLQAEDLWGQARVLISEAAQRAQAHQTLQTRQQAQVLREIGQSLIIAFDIGELMDVLAQGLSRLDIPSCYLSLYENPQAYTYPQPAPGQSRLTLAYDQKGYTELEEEGWLFPSRQLMPEKLWSQRVKRSDRPRSFVVESLYFREDQIGFALFEVGPRDGAVYHALRGQISSALKGALLVRQVRHRALQLQTAAEVSRVVSSILDPDTLIRQVVDLVHHRFELYYVGLFLVDQTGERTGEAGRWAVLHAGTGEAGQHLVAQGHKLEVGGTSMTGACMADGQPRTALDVDKEVVHSANPLLPETRSEVALPLVSRDKVIGALNIQSAQEAAFSQEDIAALQTMAGQLANAITNARLYEETRILNERLQAENLRMEAELDVTRRLQQMLLPTDEELRQIESMDIAGFMEPADEVGGDYYDVLPYDHSIKISIGDVTGHGLESGVVMLMLQTAIRTLQTLNIEDPVRFIDTLNRLLHANMQRMNVDKSITLVLLDYELGHMHMRLSGQHEQLIVVRRNGQVELKDTIYLGFPLGLEPVIAQFVSEESIDLQPGDGVVLYSDGITEAENEAKEFYGLERLCQVASAHWDEPAEAIKDAIVADVRRFIGKQKIFDDLTLLVVKQR